MDKNFRRISVRFQLRSWWVQTKIKWKWKIDSIAFYFLSRILHLHWRNFWATSLPLNYRKNWRKNAQKLNNTHVCFLLAFASLICLFFLILFTLFPLLFSFSLSSYFFEHKTHSWNEKEKLHKMKDLKCKNKKSFP